MKPRPVDDIYAFWNVRPPEFSPRCLYWLERIAGGWVPNRRLGQMGYEEAASWYGVYIYEYLNVLVPAFRAMGEG